MSSDLVELFFNKETLPSSEYLELVSRTEDWHTVLKQVGKNLAIHMVETVKKSPDKFPPDFDMEKFLWFVTFQEFMKICNMNTMMFAQDESEFDVFVCVFVDWFYRFRQKILKDIARSKQEIIQ